MNEKQTNVQKRRVLIGQLMQEGYNSSRSIAKALKERYGIDASYSTVARDMEHVRAESTTPESEYSRQVQRYEKRISSLEEMLNDKSLDKRERLATHGRLNETERQLATYQEKRKEAEAEKPWNTEEAKEARSKINLEALRKSANEHQRKLLAEIIEDLRQEPGGERFESAEALRQTRDALNEMSPEERAKELATFNLSALEKRFLNVR
jgi:chromosome segregation ATPase